jgi:hypothetical protein
MSALRRGLSGGTFLAAALIAVLGAAPVSAQVGDPELKTDHPYYPGELGLSTPARAVSTALSRSRGTLGNSTNRDKMIRLFLWRGEHYGHLLSPAVYNLPGVQPDPAGDNPLMTDYDGMRALFSYGWGVCGTNHAQMRPFTEAMGWTDRRRALPGDTGYEVYVDGGWRYYNTDQYTLHFLSNSSSAHFASLDEVISANHHYIEWNPDVGLGYFMPQANTHGNYQDFTGVTGTVANRSLQWRDYYQNIWKTIPGGNYSLYGEGYAATPIVYRLRKGESFTRWISPSGAVNDLGLAGLIWWGYNGGNMGAGDNGPYVEWSFVQNAPSRDETAGGAEESRGQQRYGNGGFDWQPDLASGEILDGAAAVTGTLTSGGSPALRSTGASKLVLSHFTPYTIAGRPTDGTDPANNAADGAVLTATATGTVGVEVSVNGGATWSSVGTLTSAGTPLDFTNAVKGRNSYLLRLSFDDAEGLSSFRLRTITMMNQGVYPNLKTGTTQVTYEAGNSGALDLSPDLWTSAAANSTSGYVQKAADSGNVTEVFYGSGSTWAYESTNNQPLSTTWKIEMPANLAGSGATWKQIQAAGCYRVRVTPVGDPYGKIEIAPALAGPWTQIAHYAPPSDENASSFWAYGNSGASSLGGTTYYVRFTTYNGGYTAAIRFLRLYATYALPASGSSVDVTYHWNNGTAQSQTHSVASGLSSDSWSITTGASVTQDKVVISVPSGGSGTAPTITTQPAHRSVTEGQTATFSVAASGTSPFTYQWKKDNVDIAGATGVSYTTPATTLADSGSQFTVTVTNGFGSDVSDPATLTVSPAGGSPVTITLRDGLNGYSGTLDTYVDQFDPASSFGTLDRVEVRYYDDGGGLSEHMQTLLRFDLSGIPSGSTVTSATLTVHNLRAAANTAGDVITMGKVKEAWTESRTWNQGLPASDPSGVTLPSVASYTLAPATPEAYVITGLGPLVQQWVITPSGNYGVILATAGNLNFRLASREYADAACRPALQVTYTTAAVSDTDGDGMTDAFEATWGFNALVADEDGNGTLDGLDDWDGDGTVNQSDSTPGPSPAAAAGGRDGKEGCGLLGLEVAAFLGLLRFRRRRRH